MSVIQIYLIGCILAIIVVISIHVFMDRKDYTAKDVPQTLFLGLFSWFTCLIGFIIFISEKEYLSKLGKKLNKNYNKVFNDKYVIFKARK